MGAQNIEGALGEVYRALSGENSAWISRSMTRKPELKYLARRRIVGLIQRSNPSLQRQSFR
jgi:hypothetical protein